jgi:hypothetical protein
MISNMQPAACCRENDGLAGERTKEKLQCKKAL